MERVVRTGQVRGTDQFCGGKVRKSKLINQGEFLSVFKTSTAVITVTGNFS